MSLLWQLSPFVPRPRRRGQFTRPPEWPTVGARFLLVAGLLSAAVARADVPLPEIFRIGFSYSLFTDVNENDARAALRALSGAIARERHIVADPDPLLLGGTDAISDAVLARRVHAISISTDEYWLLLRDHGPIFDSCLLSVQDKTPADQFVLLVRRDQHHQRLADLAGKRLAVFANARLRLAYLWLEVALARADLPPAASLFAVRTTSPKLSKVVLDLFFRRCDAALATRRGFAAMAELKPQIGEQIDVLEISPPYISSLFGFRQDIDPAFRARLTHEFSNLNKSTAGQQTLALFQTSAIAEYPLATLDASLALLGEFVQRRPELAERFTRALRASAAPPWGDLAP